MPMNALWARLRNNLVQGGDQGDTSRCDTRPRCQRIRSEAVLVEIDADGP